MIANWPQRVVELLLTTKCNMACHNCDAMVRQAPDGDTMLTVDQIKSFIKETKQMNHQWDVVILTGGEPGLHPDIGEILKMLTTELFNKQPVEFLKDGEKRPYDMCFDTDVKKGVVLLTNGKKINKMAMVYHRARLIHIENTNKTTNDQLFYPVNIAPVDQPEFCHDKIEEYARVQKYCDCFDMCLTPNGYYPCTTGASIDRVFGNDVGIMKLKDITPEKMYKQMEKMCMYCGYFNDIAPYKADSACTTPVTGTVMSPTWQKALSRYKLLGKPTLSKYE